jgi:hypothetical protein
MRNDGKEVSKAVLLTGLLKHLKAYVGKNFPRLVYVDSFIDDRGAFARYALSVNERMLILRMRIPNNAPPYARPLFDSLYYNDQLVWRYSVDYRPNVPWGEQRRIHLYHFEGFHVLIHVVSGSPRDIVEQVNHINGGVMAPELSAILRVHVARLWGMTTPISKAERRVLRALQQRGVD